MLGLIVNAIFKFENGSVILKNLNYMKTKRISDKMEKLLNRQVTNEAWNAEIYLSYGAWADEQGMMGLSNFLFRHSSEERNHMMKFMEHIMQRGGKVRIAQIPKPLKDPKNLKDCLEQIFKAEVENSKSIYEIVDLALAEKDWPSWNFLQWFVKEQIEEENMAEDLLDSYHLIGGGKKLEGSDLYQFDRDLSTKDDEADIARDASVEEAS